MNDMQKFAEIIAKKAGKILIEGFRAKETRISYKSMMDIVTNIDKESEEYLFNEISQRYPNHTIVAEEGSCIETTSDIVWYIDPLDATNNYAHGIPFFCISIGVVSRTTKNLLIGVVYDPIHDELFSAQQGCGATLNGSPIFVSSTDSFQRAFLATGFPVNRDIVCRDNITEFSQIAIQTMGIRRIGSAALDLCYTACGRFDGYWEPELKPWDMAAGALIVQEAGGMVTKYDGSAFVPEYPEIVATNGKIHKELLRHINGE
ncbi:MAG: inositol monophosphatase [Spirochaetes bacterium]|nr:inositol monophosphatase [Spirochaetota bacterium]